MRCALELNGRSSCLKRGRRTVAMVAIGGAALLLGAANAGASSPTIHDFKYGVEGWTPDLDPFPGNYGLANGDYTLQATESSVDGTLLTVGPELFDRWDRLWYRSAARLDGSGKIGLAAHYDLQADSGYAGWLDSSGKLELLRLDQGQATVLKTEPTAGLFSPGSELWLELSLWNGELAFAAGVEPERVLAQVSTTDDAYVAGQAGLVFQSAAAESVAAFHEVSWLSRYLFPGDTDGSRTVDLTDFGLFKLAFGQINSGTPADFNLDNRVDLADFGLLKNNFGKSAGSHPAAVPEPSAAVLCAAGLATFGAGRLRRRASPER